MPDAIVLVDDIRRTLSVKKMEVPARRLLLGSDPAQVTSTAAIQHLGSLEFFIRYAKSFGRPAHYIAGVIALLCGRRFYPLIGRARPDVKLKARGLRPFLCGGRLAHGALAWKPIGTEKHNPIQSLWTG